jgi:hypothetical protein
MSSRIISRVTKSYSRYWRAPANVVLRPGVQPVRSTKSSRVAARRLARLVGVVGRGEADREEGRRQLGEAGAVALGPIEQLALMVSGVDRGAGEHGVVVERRRIDALSADVV